MEKANAEEYVPSVDDEEEAEKAFKVNKGPRYMTADQVRSEAPKLHTGTYSNQSQSYTPKPIEEEDDETYAPPREPHKPKLEDGKRYNAKITRVEVIRDQPVYNHPERTQDVLVYTFLIGNIEIERRVTKSTGEMSNLNKLAKEFGYGDISLTGFDGKKLVGKSCRVKIYHSKPTQNGSVFDNIDIDSVEATNPPEGEE